MRIELLAEAYVDLRNVENWVASNFGVAKANNAVEGIYETLELLASRQLIGLVRRDVTKKNVRFYYYKYNWIIYEPGDTLVVHRIHPARMKLKRF